MRKWPWELGPRTQVSQGPAQGSLPHVGLPGSREGTRHTGSLDACQEPSLGSLALTLQLVAGLSREQSSLGEKFWGHDIPVQLCQPAWAAQALPARCGFQTMGSPDPGDHQSAWPERG